MKHAILLAVLLCGAATPAALQQSGKAVGAGPGPAPSASYVWVANNGANSVSIRLALSGNPVTVLNAPVFGFNLPHDIVGSPAHKRVFVSNQGAGTVSVIDSDTLVNRGPVNLPGCITARGMSLSEDESAIFVAGADANGPAVWEIDTVTLSAGVGSIGGIADVTHTAEDCVVIRAANSGGTGNGPGKVYFSVQTSGTVAPAPGYIGVIHINPAAAFTRILTQAGGLASVGTPINMERSPDHRFVFAACSKVVGFDPPGPTHTVRIIRIDTTNDSATAPQFATGIQDLAQTVLDVSWRTDSGGNNRGFVLVSVDNGTPQIFEIFDTGLPQPVAPQLSTAGALTAPLTLRFAALTEQVFIGDSIGTGNGYGAWDAKNAPLVFQNAPVGVGSRCLNFAVMSAPTPVVTDICPRAALVAAGMPVTVHGAGFLPTATYNGGLPLTSFIDSNTIVVDLAGPAGTVGISVDNNNFQTNTMDLFFRRYTPELRPPFTIPLPSVSQGYRMLSLPQYATLPALQAAFTAQLGPYNPVLYRVFFFRGGSYVELNTMTPDGCDLAGESFWVLTRNGAALTLSEPDVAANDGGPADNRVIPINPGFNMVSLPTLNAAGVSGAIAWPSVLVSPTPTNFGAAALPVNAAPAILTPSALEYVNGAYVTADPLIAGRGYWVENVSSSPAYLIFPPGLVSKPGNVAQAGGAPPPAGMVPPPPPSGVTNSSSGGSGGCGLLGFEGLLLALLLRTIFLRPRGHRKLAA